jgi:CheY-like chemotaxis protein
MPLVDGSASTRLIRAFEHSRSPPPSSSNLKVEDPDASSAADSSLPTPTRIPIFAVSATLTENALNDYMNTGFDGWILKPIDFQRLEAILAAIRDTQIRGLLLYGREIWERGGWFR